MSCPGMATATLLPGKIPKGKARETPIFGSPQQERGALEAARVVPLLHHMHCPMLIHTGKRCRASCAWYRGIMELTVTNQQVSGFS